MAINNRITVRALILNQKNLKSFFAVARHNNTKDFSLKAKVGEKSNIGSTPKSLFLDQSVALYK